MKRIILVLFLIVSILGEAKISGRLQRRQRVVLEARITNTAVVEEGVSIEEIIMKDSTPSPQENLFLYVVTPNTGKLPVPTGLIIPIDYPPPPPDATMPVDYPPVFATPTPTQ